MKKSVNEYQKKYECWLFYKENEEKTIVHKNFTAFLLEYAIMSPVRKTKSFAST